MKKLLSVFLAAAMTISLSASVYAGGPDAFPDEEIMVEEAAEDEILVEDTAEETALAVEDTEAPEAVLAEDTAEILPEETEEEEVGKIAPVYKYRVYVPETYTETQKYPSVYLMPYDGYSADQYFEDGIEAVLDEITGSDEAIDMIVVMPEYKAGEDYVAKLPDLVAEIESNYSVISDPAYRAILGVNVGGYMALETATIESIDHPEVASLFRCYGSLMGDFTSSDNPYLEDKGSVFNDFVDGMNSMGGRGSSFLRNKFFYIDAPNGSADSTVAGGTSDIGAGLEKRSNPYWAY
jgi:surfactin synthase thioesterase subunit